MSKTTFTVKHGSTQVLVVMTAPNGAPSHPPDAMQFALDILHEHGPAVVEFQRRAQAEGEATREGLSTSCHCNGHSNLPLPSVRDGKCTVCGLPR